MALGWARVKRGALEAIASFRRLCWTKPFRRWLLARSPLTCQKGWMRTNACVSREIRTSMCDGRPPPTRVSFVLIGKCRLSEMGAYLHDLFGRRQRARFEDQIPR